MDTIAMVNHVQYYGKVQLPRGVPPGGPEIKKKPGLTSLKLVLADSLVSGHHRNFLFFRGLKKFFKSQLGTSIRIDR